MRTLVCINDIQAEVHKSVTCPRCGADSEPLPVVQCHLEMTASGKITVNKTADCKIHGCFSIDRSIKAVRMHGRDAQIIPDHS